MGANQVFHVYKSKDKTDHLLKCSRRQVVNNAVGNQSLSIYILLFKNSKLHTFGYMYTILLEPESAAKVASVPLKESKLLHTSISQYRDTGVTKITAKYYIMANSTAKVAGIFLLYSLRPSHQLGTVPSVYIDTVLTLKTMYNVQASVLQVVSYLVAG